MVGWPENGPARVRSPKSFEMWRTMLWKGGQNLSYLRPLPRFVMVCDVIPCKPFWHPRKLFSLKRSLPKIPAYPTWTRSRFFFFEVDKFSTLRVHDGIRSSCKMLPATEWRFFFCEWETASSSFSSRESEDHVFFRNSFASFYALVDRLLVFFLSFAPVHLCC